MVELLHKDRSGFEIDAYSSDADRSMQNSPVRTRLAFVLARHVGTAAVFPHHPDGALILANLHMEIILRKLENLQGKKVKCTLTHHHSRSMYCAPET